eukprot:g77150.t1
MTVGKHVPLSLGSQKGILWRFRREGDPVSSRRIYNMFIANYKPIYVTFPSLWKLYQQQNSNHQAAASAIVAGSLTDVTFVPVRVLTRVCSESAHAFASCLAFLRLRQHRSRDCTMSHVMSSILGRCAAIVDTVLFSDKSKQEVSIKCAPSGWRQLHVDCQACVHGLRNVTKGQLSLRLVTISELDFSSKPCIVKTGDGLADRISSVVNPLSDASYPKPMLPVVRVVGDIPSWALPVDVRHSAQVSGCDVGLAPCGCCSAQSEFGVMGASCRPVPKTSIAYDQTNYFIKKSAVYQQCLRDFRDTYDGPESYERYQQVPNMQALINDMKFMGSDEPGCRQSDFAKPQPGDIKGVNTSTTLGPRCVLMSSGYMSQCLEPSRHLMSRMDKGIQGGYVFP